MPNMKFEAPVMAPSRESLLKAEQPATFSPYLEGLLDDIERESAARDEPPNEPPEPEPAAQLTPRPNAFD